ncbi:MAG: hypothetical protein AAF264_10835 [Pseudomonadota bacterium]
MEFDPILWEALVESRAVQATIAGAFVATGWLVNGWQNRRTDSRLRAARTRDAHKALFAEIQNALATFYGEGQAAADAEALVERMRGDPDFVPFIPREHHDRVFVTLLPDIDVLPRQTIDAIVAFYSQVAAIESLAGDMRGDGFVLLRQDRRIDVYQDYVAMRVRAFTMGEYVLNLIAAYADGGVPGAERIARQAGAASVSSQASDRSGPEDPESG